MTSLNYSMDFGQWTRAFATIKARATDLQPAHEKIGDYLVGEIVDNIEAQGNGAWTPLKRATLEARHRKYPDAGDKMLIVTRALIDSIAKHATNAYADAGSALKKARTLFFGRGAIPGRFPFRWKPGVLDRVGGMYLEHLFGRLK